MSHLRATRKHAECGLASHSPSCACVAAKTAAFTQGQTQVAYQLTGLPAKFVATYTACHLPGVLLVFGLRQHLADYRLIVWLYSWCDCIEFVPHFARCRLSDLSLCASVVRLMFVYDVQQCTLHMLNPCSWQRHYVHFTCTHYCRTLFFRCILISRFSYVENSLHFNFADFPVGPILARMH